MFKNKQKQSFSVHVFEYINISFCYLWSNFHDFHRILEAPTSRICLKACENECWSLSSQAHESQLMHIALGTDAHHLTLSKYIPAGYSNYEEKDGHHITFIPVILHIQFKFFH